MFHLPKNSVEAKSIPPKFIFEKIKERLDHEFILVSAPRLSLPPKPFPEHYNPLIIGEFANIGKIKR